MEGIALSTDLRYAACKDLPKKTRSLRSATQKNTGKMAFGAIALTALALAGCTVGPNYRRPPVETPSAWKEQPPEGWKNATPSDEISKGDWWQVFSDPVLNDLELQAIAANQNLKAAVERVIEAQESARAVRSNLYPQAGLSPSVGRARTSGNRPVAPGSSETAFSANTFALPAQASYIVDLFGQVRRQVESSSS